MKRKRENPVVSLTSCLIIIIFAVMIFVGLAVFFAVRSSGNRNQDMAILEKAVVTVIPAPTLTPTIYITKEPQTLDIHYVSEDGLSIGTIVEVYDTGSTGLSIRPQPGTGGYLNFVAQEGERFVIVDGPDAKNDYIWWKLEVPNHPDRSGWAVSDYLKPVLH